jgi:hypothetical protein
VGEVRSGLFRGRGIFELAAMEVEEEIGVDGCVLYKKSNEMMK